MANKNSNIISSIVFVSTITIVVLSLVSVIFPALILGVFGPHDYEIDPLERGAYAFWLIGISIIIFGVGFLFQGLPLILQRFIKFVLNFEVNKLTAFVIVSFLIFFYVGFSFNELSLNEEEQWRDFVIVKEALKIWPSGESTDLYITEMLNRHVRMFLFYVSENLFGNIKIIPFLSSILLLLVTYFITKEITQKRFAGIISMLVLLQSYTFLMYDTVAVYANFWSLFYILSLYTIYKKWVFSPIFYILSIFSKAFVLTYFPVSLFFIFRSKLQKKQKILAIISYFVVIGFTFTIFSLDENIYGEKIEIRPLEFLMGFTVWAHQLRFDYLMIFTILPLTVGLFLQSRRGILVADSILVLILGALLTMPILSLLTDFFFINPYRFVPMTVFFAIGIGVFFSRRD